MVSMADTEFCDVLIFGTSLVHAILAAALQSAGLVVMHLDENDYYGQADGCFPLPFCREALSQYFVQAEIKEGPAYGKLGAPNSYNIELAPKILYSASEVIQYVRDIGISDYIQFKSLSSFYIHNGQTLRRVPCSKEDIFTDTTMPLIAKRRLMKFVKFATSFEDDALYEQFADRPMRDVLSTHFRLEGDISDALIYSLAQASTPQSTTADCLPVMNIHLQSIGLFGAFPAVIPMYGSSSELTQAFCRKAAVKGCTYILGHKIASRDANSVVLSSGLTIRAKKLVEKSLSETKCTWRRNILVDGEFHELLDGGDGAVIAFAPKDNAIVHCQIHGSGTGECPQMQSMLYMSLDGLSETSEQQAFELFDWAQRLLLSSEHQVITSIQFCRQEQLQSRSYDDTIGAARKLFLILTDGTSKEFLPREHANEESQFDELA